MAATTDPDLLLERVRTLCLALPEATEKLSHGSPTFCVRKTFLTWVDDHHGDGNIGFWCAAPPGEQAGILAADPERFSSVRRTSVTGAGSVCGSSSPTARPPTGTR